jgi:hypothetical protein
VIPPSGLAVIRGADIVCCATLYGEEINVGMTRPAVLEPVKDLTLMGGRMRVCQALAPPTVAKKYNSPNQPEGTRKEGTSVLHNVQVPPQG